MSLVHKIISDNGGRTTLNSEDSACKHALVERRIVSKTSFESNIHDIFRTPKNPKMISNPKIFNLLFQF